MIKKKYQEIFCWVCGVGPDCNRLCDIIVLHSSINIKLMFWIKHTLYWNSIHDPFYIRNVMVFWMKLNIQWEKMIWLDCEGMFHIITETDLDASLQKCLFGYWLTISQNWSE